ncbi:UDP-glucose 4-epimerase-like [Styela clava]
MSEYILVTGGAGYIGSHTVVDLLENGFCPVVVDNCVNAIVAEGHKTPESIRRIETITGEKVIFHNVDLCNKKDLESIFEKYKFSAIMHFAGLKSVNESVSNPMNYYEVNLGATINLIECMKAYNIFNIVFSSSATVYGIPERLPIDESHPVGNGITNPYGKTKYFIEEIFRDLAKAESQWKIILLRYFNPVGSHVSGLIGEDPQGPPNNLMPYVAQVAIGRRPILSIFGNDYDTPDGTGVRDFIHVVDLAKGHISALKHINEVCGCKAYNLGTGKGYSVLEAVEAFKEASNKDIPYKFAPRRLGDLGDVHADPTLAKKELNWTANWSLSRMCEDLWRWQTMNPTGYNPNEKI